MPEWVANSPFPVTAVIGLDDASETFYVMYADAGGIHRVYRMGLDGGVWKIWGQPGPEFHQRFTGTFFADGNTITALWEKSRDAIRWERDFDLTYLRLR